jgi:hypothetical protein
MTMEQTATSLASLSAVALRQVYLSRLRRLRQLRLKHELELNPQGIRLLDRSLFAAYCDCVDIGAEAEARSILREAVQPELSLALTSAPACPQAEN